MSIQRRTLIVNGAATALALTTLGRSASAQSRTQGISDSEILIGSHQDLSGPVAALGSPLRDGMLLAVDDINAAGGINGRQVRMLVEDTAFDPKKAVLATEKLVGQDKVFAMIACLGSAPVQASMPLMLDANVPVLFSGPGLQPHSVGIRASFADMGQTIAGLIGLSASECSVKKGAVWWLRNRERVALAQTVVVTVQSPEVL